MPPYLLDTDSIIDYLKGLAFSVAFTEELDRHGMTLATCDIVVAEVHAGLCQAL
jgi:predicted nucleic acid-binding protein